MKWKGGRREGRVEDRRGDHRYSRAEEATRRAHQTRQTAAAMAIRRRGPLVIESRNGQLPMRGEEALKRRYK